jgi:hypothetical protein
MSKDEIKKYLAELGRKGGKAGKGKSKVRGGSDYYRKLRMKGLQKTKRSDK